MRVTKKVLFSDPQDEFEQDKSIIELAKYYQRISPMIISIIKKDPTLKKLFKNTMYELSEKAKGLKLFEDLKKEFS